MSERDITTTDGETFTYRETCVLAATVHKRFGRDLEASTAAWNRMMQTNVSVPEFIGLLEDYAIGEAWKRSRAA